VNDLEARIATLEQHAVLRSELRAEIMRAAHELRDNKDFSHPYWRQGLDVMADHGLTKMGRKVLIYVVGACAAAFLLWLGSLGVLWK
jgi:dephospho-CoA kinase